MKVARPARAVVGQCLAASRASNNNVVLPALVSSCHHFHSSSAARARGGKSRFRNVKAEELGLLKNPENMAKYKQEKFPDYTKQELDRLRTQYTPEQMEAIEAAEKAIDTTDMIMQGRIREDAHRPEYIDDYTEMDPRYDLKSTDHTPPREPEFFPGEEGRNAWMDAYGKTLADLAIKKTDHQMTRAMVRALRKVKANEGAELLDLTEDELQDMEKNPELAQKYLVDDDGGSEPSLAAEKAGPDTMDRAEAIKLDTAINKALEVELEKISAGLDSGEIEPNDLELLEEGPGAVKLTDSVIKHDLGKVPGVVGLFKTASDPADQGQDDAGEFQEIKRLTGMTLAEIQSLYRKTLVYRQVHNQTRLGKVRSQAVVAIAGNGNGRLGLGIAKSTEPGVASGIAQLLAIRNMKPIRRYENRTIYGNVSAKVSGTIVELSSRPPGFGLRCPHRIFEMCRACGIHDIAANMPRSKNPMNSVKAAYQALVGQPDPEAIAIGRGKKLVDVRKVYYGGAVH